MHMDIQPRKVLHPQSALHFHNEGYWGTLELFYCPQYIIPKENDQISLKD